MFLEFGVENCVWKITFLLFNLWRAANNQGIALKLNVLKGSGAGYSSIDTSESEPESVSTLTSSVARSSSACSSSSEILLALPSCWSSRSLQLFSASNSSAGSSASKRGFIQLILGPVCRVYQCKLTWVVLHNQGVAVVQMVVGIALHLTDYQVDSPRYPESRPQKLCHKNRWNFFSVHAQHTHKSSCQISP